MDKLTFDQIKELVTMGFTPDQITKLTISADTIPAEQAGTGLEGNSFPFPDSPSVPAIVENSIPPEPVEKPVETVDNSAGLISAIEDLKKTLQASNIRTVSIDTVAPENDLESIMAEFIRPNYKKEE